MFGLTISQLAIAVVIVAAIVAIVYIALRAFGVVPPAWASQIAWVIVIAFVAVVAILLLVQLWAAAGHSP